MTLLGNAACDRLQDHAALYSHAHRVESPSLAA